MTSRKYLPSLVLAVCSLMLSSGAQAQNALDTILKNKKITIAVPPDFPPYGSMGADFKIQGLDADMAHYIGAKLGVTVDLIPVTLLPGGLWRQDTQHQELCGPAG
jgi:polar amino acid transport system substrate-binding protein